MRYRVEENIYRPSLSPWRVLIGIGLIVLTIFLIRQTLAQSNEVERVPNIVVTVIVGIVTFIYIFSSYNSYFSHNAVNGMYALATSFLPDDINREIAYLDFQEIVENTGIHKAENWLVLQTPGDKTFILLPIGMIRFVSYKKVLTNYASDDVGESYNVYTFSFYLTNGQISEYKLPLEFYGKKAHRNKVNSNAVKEKFLKVQTVFQNIFSARFVDSINDAWIFLYRKKKAMLESAFEHDRKSRTKKDIFTKFVEFLPIETMHIDEERHHVISKNRVIRYGKVIAWIILILGKALLKWIASYELQSPEDKLLAAITQGTLVVISIFMLVVYTYETIKTLIIRRQAREREKTEEAWLRGMTLWYVRQENSLFLKLSNLAFWGWVLFKNLEV